MNKDIFLTNNLTNKKEKFVPIDKNKIGMYVCGPTVYDDPHIGNARPLVIFDILFKVLKCKYGNKSVTYIRNITDVDDKIIKSSQDNNIAISDLTKKIIICFTKKTDGRSKLNTIKTPEDLGLVYDGNDCPISNLYTIKQTRKMFSKFKILEIEPHYFPVRYIKLIPIKHGSFLHRIADNYFGTGLYCLLKKP